MKKTRWLDSEGNLVVPESRDELARFLEVAFGLRFPEEARCPGHVSPLDALWDSYSAKHPVAIWVASRGFGGKTTLMAALSLAELMTKFDVVLLGGSLEQTKRVHAVTENAWNYDSWGLKCVTQTSEGKDCGLLQPIDPLNRNPEDQEDTCYECGGHALMMVEYQSLRSVLRGEPLVTKTTTRWKNTMIALAASTKSVRGPHPQRLRLDEADETEIAIVDAAMGQTMMTDPTRKAQITFGCFPAGQLVVGAEGGLTEIERVRVGDRTLSADGSIGTVLAVHSRFTEELLQETWVRGLPEPIISTRGHVFVLDGGGERPAEQLRVGDVLNVPKRRLRRTVGKTFETGWLVGLFLAEGSERPPPSRHGLEFAVHEDEAGLVLAKLQEWVRRWGGRKREREPWVADDPRCRGVSVRVASRSLRRLIDEWVESVQEYPGQRGMKRLRKLPDKLVFARGVLAGWLGGDGDLSMEVSATDHLLRWAGGRTRGREGGSVCRDLVWQMRQLAVDCGLRASVYERDPSDSRSFGTRKSYHVYVSREAAHPGERRVEHPSKGRVGQIVEIRHRPYRGEVFDLTVEGDHTYSMQGVGVHNSTHHYELGTMTELLKRAGERDWPVYEWCVSADAKVALVGGEQKSIRYVRTGDLIYNRHLAPTKVVDCWRVGLRKVVRLCYTGGAIICTDDHLIRTPNGWRKAGELRHGDKIESLSRLRSTEQTRFTDETMLGLLQPVAVQEAVSQASARPSGSALRVWCAEVKSGSEDVSNVLVEGVVSAEPGRCGAIGFGAAAGCFEWQCSEAPVEAGTSSRGCTAGARSFVGGADTDSKLGCGLYDPFGEVGRRGLWSLLAHDLRQRSARCQEAERDQEAGLAVGDPLGRRVPSVVAATVLSVEPAGIEEVWDLAVEEGESFVADGVIVHNCWKETILDPSNSGSWLLPENVEEKRLQVTTHQWEVEYDLEQPDEGGSLFNKELRDGLFAAGDRIDDILGRYYEFEEPDEDADYATGADWGKDQSYSVIATLRYDCEPARLVALERHFKQPWPKVIARFNERVRRFPGKATHDATGIGGHVIDDYLEVRADPYEMLGRMRSQLFLDYENAVGKRKIEYPPIRSLIDVHTYTKRDDVYGRGHPPDEIVALAMCVQAAELRPARKKKGGIGRIIRVGS